MNPLLEKQTAEVRTLLEELASLIEAKASRYKAQDKENRQLQQTFFEQKKRISVLETIETDFDALTGETERLRAQRRELALGLRELLRHTRALGNYFQK